ncbi:MAG: hypothetical protein D6780_01405 [Candidatus Dadabacteria bacterium]|nr:MAG: hypothetical protein D6780_01405 [Candidatus Dadabacteria bacterium]
MIIFKNILIGLLIWPIASTVLPEGATFYHTIKLYGPPIKKEVFEVKRKQIWEFKEVKVTFQDGKAVLVEEKGSKTLPVALQEERKNLPAIKEEQVKTDLRQLFSEIAKVSSSQQTRENKRSRQFPYQRSYR